MPAHVIHFASGLSGPQIEVGLDVGSVQAAWGGGPPGSWNALIDTGSTCTAISPAVRSLLIPRPIGKARVARGRFGLVWEDTYFVRLQFESQGASGRWFNLEVIEAQPLTPGVDVLVGMDLLVRINMVWDGPNRQVVLAY